MMITSRVKKCPTYMLKGKGCGWTSCLIVKCLVTVCDDVCLLTGCSFVGLPVGVCDDVIDD